jgi:hypothetical protein
MERALSLFNGQAASLEAELGHGTPGYFLAQAGPCAARCAWTGEFISADGRVTGKDVIFSGSYAAMRVGSRVPVLYPGNPGHLVFPRHGNWGWVRLVIVPVAVLAFLVAVTAWASSMQVMDYWRGRRHRTAAAASGQEDPGS